ncbi:hypothetical protein SELMODRAFT_404585 [Selaginella moellendorffii]|uniref:Uncharacterized protein n=1 Tax=Selaginella moellendorffii TaxID=88036 RepID=D8QVT2_SELML|nr:hypothetical protein SELMODRAFT_404585 [Selaginella moellendorffii]
MQFMQPFPYFCGPDKFAAQEKIGSCKRKLVGFSGDGDLKKSLGLRRTYWRIVSWLCIQPFLQSWGKYDWMYGVYFFFGLYSKDSSATYPNGEYIHGLLYLPREEFMLPNVKMRGSGLCDHSKLFVQSLIRIVSALAWTEKKFATLSMPGKDSKMISKLHFLDADDSDETQTEHGFWVLVRDGRVQGLSNLVTVLRVERTLKFGTRGARPWDALRASKGVYAEFLDLSLIRIVAGDGALDWTEKDVREIIDSTKDDLKAGFFSENNW